MYQQRYPQDNYSQQNAWRPPSLRRKLGRFLSECLGIRRYAHGKEAIQTTINMIDFVPEGGTVSILTGRPEMYDPTAVALRDLVNRGGRVTIVTGPRDYKPLTDLAREFPDGFDISKLPYEPPVELFVTSKNDLRVPIMGDDEGLSFFFEPAWSASLYRGRFGFYRRAAHPAKA